MDTSNHTSRDKEFLSKLTQIVIENLNNEQFGVNELSKEIGYNRSYLHRKLNSLKSQSISQFIREVRLEEALELLKHYNLTASEVAYRVGFNNPTYFNTCFHQFYGFTPGEVKHQVISKNKEEVINNEETVIKKGSFKKEYIIISSGILTIILLVIGFLNIKLSKADEEKSIAILPFENLSSSKENQYFADGLVEDLLDRLSKIEDLKVISRTSSEVFRFKDDMTIPEIAAILGVSHILEGSIQRHDKKIKVNVQLINARHDDHILSEQYNRDLNDIFEIQGEIANEIVSKLSLALTSEERLALKKEHTDNIKAFEYCQLGYHHTCDCSDGSKALWFFNKAIEEDSLYGFAYAGLASLYAMWLQSPLGNPLKMDERKDSALMFAKKALQLDPNLASAHVAIGICYAHGDWNWELAEKEYLKAIKLDPNYSLSYFHYAKMLHILGRYTEARSQINKAINLNPYALGIRYYSAYFYYNNEQFSEALSEVKICQELDSNFIQAGSLEYDLMLRTGKDSSAYQYLKKLYIGYGWYTKEEMDSVYNLCGHDGVIRWNIDRNKMNVPDYYHAVFYAMLQEKEKTLYCLEMALDSNALKPWETALWEYKFVRSEPRFIAIREKMGLLPLPL